MKRFHFKIYRYILSEKNYPFSTWTLIFFIFFKLFAILFIFNSLFLNFVTNSSFMQGIGYSFVFSFLSIPIMIVYLFNPFEFLKIIYITLEKITDNFLIKMISLLKK